MDIEGLKFKANSILDLGGGGKHIAHDLILAARAVPNNTTIVDIAPFLGSTTAFLAFGLIEGLKKNVNIVAIDKWEIDEEYYIKTKDKIKFPDNNDIYPMFRENLKPFSAINITAYKMDLRKFDYNMTEKKPISLVIDDICSPKPLTDHMFSNLLSYCLPGKTLFFFMDFYWYQFRKLEMHRQYQCDMMSANSKVFKFERKINNTKTAIYRYLGGIPKYLKDKKYNLKGFV